MKILYIFFIIILFFNCGKVQKDGDTFTFPSNNKEELLKVLKHYSSPEDSLKLKAAKFLITNMDGHFSTIYANTNEYYARVDSIFSCKDISREESFKLLETLHLKSNLSWTLNDDENIKASYLIEHIDLSFETRNYPWNKDLSFDLFCEYVLPYRVLDEPLESWLPRYNQYFQPTIDSLIKTEASYEEIGHLLLNRFFYLYNKNIYNFETPLTPSLLLKMNAGTCRELTQLTIYTMRTFGIPVTWDFTPQWANRSMGHDWVSIWTKDKCTPFLFGDHVQFGDHIKEISNNKFGKVYRKTFKRQRNTRNDHLWFLKEYVEDVSHVYFNGADITVDVAQFNNNDTIMLSVFDNKKWIPIHYAEVIDKKATFSYMQKGCVYQVLDSNQQPILPAFILETDGDIHFLDPDTNKLIKTKLLRKYPPNRNHHFIVGGVINGRFEAANKPDFSGATTLYTIDNYPQFIIPMMVKVNQSNKAYKYFRYVSNEIGRVYMAEIKVYDERNNQLSGEVIGTDGSFNNWGNDKTKVFDNDPLTYFDAPFGVRGWVGLSFKQKKIINKITFLPLNDDNHINKGERYELFYWNQRWISLGEKIGTDSFALVYDNVPTNALLLLKNHTKGIEERIFTYKHNNQIWW